MGTLKVTGGVLRSRRVSAPSGRAVRPTPSRVKEALFSILAARVAGARVLDLFAGSGALGFEALSRGASCVTFVEAHRPTAATLKRTAGAFDVADRVEVIAAPVERSAALLRGRYDLVFADPPYAQPFPAAAFARLHAAGAIDAETTIVYEHSAALPPPAVNGFAVVRTARYGAVALAFMRAAA